MKALALLFCCTFALQSDDFRTRLPAVRVLKEQCGHHPRFVTEVGRHHPDPEVRKWFSHVTPRAWADFADRYVLPATRIWPVYTEADDPYTDPENPPETLDGLVCIDGKWRRIADPGIRYVWYTDTWWYRVYVGDSPDVSEEDRYAPPVEWLRGVEFDLLPPALRSRWKDVTSTHWAKPLWHAFSREEPVLPWRWSVQLELDNRYAYRTEVITRLTQGEDWRILRERVEKDAADDRHAAEVRWWVRCFSFNQTVREIAP